MKEKRRMLQAVPREVPLLKHESKIMNAGEGVEKREPSYTVGENVNWYSHCGEQYGGSLKNLKIELPCDPTIPPLGIYTEKTMVQKDAPQCSLLHCLQ